MSELSVILISPFWTQFHCFALISLFCTGEIALLTNLGLIDMFSANQTAEIVACILSPKKLSGFSANQSNCNVT